MADEEKGDETYVPDNGDAPPSAGEGSQSRGNTDGDVVGSAAIRPVFLGNLRTDFVAADVEEIFTRPIAPAGSDPGAYKPFAVDRVDLKRGYCFVFLQDASSQEEKESIERFVSEINGIEVENLTKRLRAEFARGDGRVKRKEDDRRRNIQPSDTLFVVNFHEETTKQEDLQMLFEPFGEIIRVDMKRNYAFVQFRTIEEATKAKETTNGGKLDQSVLTVEYVANQRRTDRDGGRGRRRDDYNRRGGGGGGDRRGGGPDRFRGGAPDRGDRYDGGRRDDFRGRDRSPGGYRGRSPRGGGYRGRYPSPGRYRGRSRSRSRSPPRGYRSRSPPRRSYDDRDRGGRYDDYRDASPPRGRDYDDRDRGRYDEYRDGRRSGGSAGGGGGGWSPDGHRARDDRGYRA